MPRLYIFIFCLMLISIGGYEATTPLEDLITGGQDMLSAYDKSGAPEATDTFQAGGLHEVLASEKKKTFACEQLVNEILSKAENEQTQHTLEEQECNQIVNEKIKDITDEEARHKAQLQFSAMCNDMAKKAIVSQEDKEREKLKQMEKCQDLLQSALSAVDEASEKTANLPSPEQQSCTRDYSSLCPSGWFDTGDGSTCEAPPSYSGSCATLGTFAKNAEDKKAIERRCAVYWPCLEECDRDYEALCPEGWTDIGGGKCSAPFSFSGRCERVYNFSRLSKKEKDKWGMICGVHWPCQAPCERDYTSSCPQGWKSIGSGTCEAPVEYAGQCGPTANLESFTDELKAVFEKKCNVLFPCKKTCRQDFATVCPESWLLISFQTCSPPDSYSGPCKENQNFEGMTEKDKIMFSAKCGVSWPCATECRRDYSEQCPLGWISAGKYCLAPSSYNGPCESKKNFADYSVDMKAAASLQCKIYWPCESEAIARPMVQGEMELKKRRRLPRLKLPGVSGPIEPETGMVMAVPP